MAPGRQEIGSETHNGVIRYTFNGKPASEPLESLRAVRAWCRKIKTGDGGFGGDEIGLRKLAKTIEDMAVTEVKRGNLAP
jgi:hypothetical protein